jgi:hypothetical protein
VSGFSNEPRNLVERAADKALEALELELERADATLEKALVLIVAGNVPAGYPTSTTAGHGVDDARDLIGLLASHLVSTGREVGIRIELVPVDRIGRDS